MREREGRERKRTSEIREETQFMYINGEAPKGKIKEEPSERRKPQRRSIDKTRNKERRPKISRVCVRICMRGDSASAAEMGRGVIQTATALLCFPPKHSKPLSDHSTWFPNYIRRGLFLPPHPHLHPKPHPPSKRSSSDCGDSGVIPSPYEPCPWRTDMGGK